MEFFLHTNINRKITEKRNFEGFLKSKMVYIIEFSSKEVTKMINYI